MPLGTAKCQLKEDLPANMKCLAGELEVLECLYPEDLVCVFFLAGRFACGESFMLPSVGFVGSLVETLWPMEVGKKIKTYRSSTPWMFSFFFPPYFSTLVL